MTSNKKFTQFVWPKKSNVDASSVYTPLHGNTCSTSSSICDNLCKIVPYSRRVFHTLEIHSIPKKSDVNLIAADWTTKITSTSRYDSINKIVHYSQRVFDKLKKILIKNKYSEVELITADIYTFTWTCVSVNALMLQVNKKSSPLDKYRQMIIHFSLTAPRRGIVSSQIISYDNPTSVYAISLVKVGEIKELVNCSQNA